MILSLLSRAKLLRGLELPEAIDYHLGRYGASPNAMEFVFLLFRALSLDRVHYITDGNADIGNDSDCPVRRA